MELYCQSCGMPFQIEADLGRNADGTINRDYCAYCYQEGKFTSENTVEEMIELCIPFVLEGNKEMNEHEARKMLQEFFPTLKRWRSE